METSFSCPNFISFDEKPMEYLDEFKEFVNYCNQNGKYVGWGNPNSKILIVGKESAMEEPDESYNK